MKTGVRTDSGGEPYEYMESFMDPTMAAISTLLILMTLLIALTLERIVGVSKLFGLR